MAQSKAHSRASNKYNAKADRFAACKAIRNPARRHGADDRRDNRRRLPKNLHRQQSEANTGCQQKGNPSENACQDGVSCADFFHTKTAPVFFVQIVQNQYN